jgi:hypothetical protein
MIYHAHAPSLKAIHLLSNRTQYATTVEEHHCDGSVYYVLRFHGSFGSLSASAAATLAVELLVFRMCFKPTLLTIEDQPGDERWEDFLGTFGFQYSSDLPCTDGQARRLFVSPAIHAGRE